MFLHLFCENKEEEEGMAYFPFEEKRRRRRRKKRETKLILCVVFSCKGYYTYGLFEEGLIGI